LPNQLIAVIGDPLLQKYLQLKSSVITDMRLNHWLLDFFEEQLEDPDAAEAVILQMLEAIRDYTRYAKVSLLSLSLMTFTDILPGTASRLPIIPQVYARFLEWSHRPRSYPRSFGLHSYGHKYLEFRIF
jgi:hypothetical protein